jgi:hypothetical protein
VARRLASFVSRRGSNGNALNQTMCLVPETARPFAHEQRGGFCLSSSRRHVTLRSLRQALRPLIPRIADVAADRPRRHLLRAVRPWRRVRFRCQSLRIEPRREIGRRDDDRHPVVDGPHHLVWLTRRCATRRCAGDQCRRSGLACRWPRCVVRSGWAAADPPQPGRVTSCGCATGCSSGGIVRARRIPALFSAPFGLAKVSQPSCCHGAETHRLSQPRVGQG